MSLNLTNQANSNKNMSGTKRGIAPRIVHRIWCFSTLPLQKVENYNLYIVDNFDGIVLKEEICIVGAALNVLDFISKVITCYKQACFPNIHNTVNSSWEWQAISKHPW